MNKLVVLSGAGVSQESGLETFRDKGGIWENHRIEDVATPQAFEKNPEKVLNFYNERRKQLLQLKPNQAHHYIASLENYYQVSVVTQNIDNFHEQAGSTNVIHLHGELLKSKTNYYLDKIYDQNEDIKLGDTDDKGHQLRPHVVWFGEVVPLMPVAIDVCQKADIALVIGTSLQVYPAAGLINELSENTKVYLIDPYPQVNPDRNLEIIQDKAVSGMKKLYTQLINTN